jgi:glycosyltransferase involved in cell wall biosynthesis
MHVMPTENDAPGDAPTEPPLVSVVIATFNRRDLLQACLASVSALDYPRFEALVCVDSLSEVSAEAVRELAGDCEKIRVLVSEGRSGTSATRNAGIEQARGEIVFFTDDDVVVPSDWLARGVPHFKDKRVVGIEGRIVYVCDGYRLRYGDRVVENRSGGLYMTANAAYRRESLIEAGMFDEDFPHFQDRELAHRLRERGEIAFVEDCVVYHQLDRYTARSFMAEAIFVREMILLMKQTGDRTPLVGRVYAPSKIAAIVFPPLILLRLLSRRMSSPSDALLFLLSYPRLCFERLTLWRAAVAERFFVL